MGKEWYVKNSIFVGRILCDKTEDQALMDLGVKMEVNSVWIPCAIDLRTICLVRQRVPDEDGDDSDHSTLEATGDTGGTFVVNARASELIEHFIASRHG